MLQIGFELPFQEPRHISDDKLILSLIGEPVMDVPDCIEPNHNNFAEGYLLSFITEVTLRKQRNKL
jgi:hypothetical protein